MAPQQTEPAVRTPDKVLLKKVDETLKEYNAQINSAIQLNQIADSVDIKDFAFIRIVQAKNRLDDAVQEYNDLANDDCGSRGEPECKFEDSKTKKKSFAKRLLSKLIGKLSKKNNGSQEVDKWDMATQELSNARDALIKESKMLATTSSQRSPVNDMGSFYTLAHCHKLVSTENQSGVALKGRYEHTGIAMFQLVTKFARIEEALNTLDAISGDDISVTTMKRLYKKLGVACDTTIAFLLSVPFDLSEFEEAVDGLEIHGETLQRFVEGQLPPEGLFDGQSIPLNFESDNGTYKHEQMAREIAAIETNLKTRKAKYELEKEEFDDNLAFNAPQWQALENLGLKQGDLSDIPVVVRCMTKSREEGGLGLPVISVGNTVAPDPINSGGYGAVYRMELPADAVGVDDIKSAGRLIAVKIVKSEIESSIANLYMLREASVWTAAASDPRKLVDGRQYLAQVLGVWDDFRQKRPGLVSLWGESNLKEVVQSSTLDVMQRLQLAHKVAQGVRFLHTCDPVIVHGDLKAANVIMVDGEPRLTDFGVGKRLDGVRGFTNSNSSYTDDYRAPEIEHRAISLQRYPSTASDVYAFGCALFEILSGKAPLDDLSVTARKKWINNNLDGTPLDAEASKPKPHSFEKEHRDLMKWCFNFHASKRPTMQVVVELLENLLNPPPPQVDSDTP